MKSSFIRMLATFAALILSSFAARALTQNVIFVNGIQNTFQDALANKRRLEAVLDASINHPAPAKRDFSVTLVYNPIGYYGIESGETDFAQDYSELFLLKTAEEMYKSDLLEISSPFNNAKSISAVVAKKVAAFYLNMLPSRAASISPANNLLELTGLVTELNMVPTKNVVNAIIKLAKGSSKSTVIVAHSQGNPLANLAYASLASDLGSDISKSIRVLNVANTSEFSVNGLDFTHNDDNALALEKLSPRKLNWFRVTPSCLDLCDFKLSPPNFSGGSFGLLDLQHHAFDEVYLSSAPLINVLNGMGVTFTSGKFLFHDRFEDLVYAASESLDKSNIEPTSGKVNVGSDIVLHLINDDGRPMLPIGGGAWLSSDPSIATFETAKNLSPECPSGPAGSCAVATGLKAGTVTLSFTNRATGAQTSTAVAVVEGDFAFEISVVGGISGAKKYVCAPYLGQFGQSLSGSIDQCADGTNIRIRCVGVACKSGRFMASTNGGDFTVNRRPVGPWAQLGVTCDSLKANVVQSGHQAEADKYASGSVFWFDIGRGDWVKPSPLFANLGAGSIMSLPFYMNETLVYRPNFGDCISYQMITNNVRFNIIDLTNGSYRTVSGSSIVP